MASRTTTEEHTDEISEVAAVVASSKNHPPLSTLCSPSWEFLHRNYTKSELQKYCDQLQLRGIWTTKDKLIDKLMIYYSSLQGTSSEAAADQAISVDQERENKD